MTTAAMRPYLKPLPLNRQSPAFDPELPTHQLVWDSTSYSAWQKCPFFYYLSILCGYRPRGNNVNLAFGLAFHSAMQMYFRLRDAEDTDHEDALRAVVAAAYYRQLRAPGENITANHGYHEESIPQDPDRPHAKNAQSLVRTLVAYLDHYATDPNRTWTYPDPDTGVPRAAVELSFRLSLPHADGSPSQYSWAGHLDRVVVEESISSAPPRLWVHDFKTTSVELNSRYWNQWSPDIQMTGYTLGLMGIAPEPFRPSGVIVDAIRLDRTGTAFGREPISRTPSQLEEFMIDFQQEAETARICAERDSWPMRRTSCIGPYGPCRFREICTRPPASRFAFLEADFERKPWDPTIER